MYFGRAMLEHGPKIARKLCNYSHAQAWRLINDPRIKRYQLSLLGVAFEDIGLTLGDIIKKRMALADDKSQPGALRDSIYKDLIEMVRSVGEGVEDSMKLIGGGKQMLKPSKEIIQDAEIVEEKDGDSKEQSKEGRGEGRTAPAGTVQGKADNRSTA